MQVEILWEQVRGLGWGRAQEGNRTLGTTSLQQCADFFFFFFFFFHEISINPNCVPDKFKAPVPQSHVSKSR